MTKKGGNPVTEAQTVDLDAGAIRDAVENKNLPATQPNANATQLYDPTQDEWADVDAGDLTGDVGGHRIPFIALNRKFGYGFDLAGNGENYVTELQFVWLAKGRSRVWFREPFGQGDGKPKCRSFDGRTADPNSPDLQNGGDCRTCPHAQWDGNTPPDCMESIEALVFIPDPSGFGQLGRLRFSGMALAPARSYWDSFFTRLPKRPPIAYVSRCVLEPVDTDNGKFLVPRFERVTELGRREAQPLIDERAARTADWTADVADDAVAGVHHAESTDTEFDTGPFEDEEPF